MDCCLSRHTHTLAFVAPQFLPSALKPDSFGSSYLSKRFSVGGWTRPSRRRSLSISAGPSHCEPSSLNTPLVPRSPAGRHLSRVLQNQRPLFHVAVDEELKQLADDRDAAAARMVLSDGSDEAFLHRRIMELKERDCKDSIEDVMYMLILFKFSEIRVQLIPKISRCIYNKRLEIWPAKDWELESIYSYDVLEMIREHVSVFTGLRPNSSVTDLWATKKVCLQHLSDIYSASALYGYFLKSASMRHKLEGTLSMSNNDIGNLRNSLQPSNNWPYGWNNLVFGHRGSILEKPSPRDRTSKKLNCYVMDFDLETWYRCAKVKSEVAKALIEKQTYALFGDTHSMWSGEEEAEITTSYSSLKRLVLEAVAFGSFLWDIEDHVDSVYSIRGN